MFFIQGLVSKSSDCNSSICQVNSGHVEQALIGPLLNDSLFSSEDRKNVIENRKNHWNNFFICCLISFILFILFTLYFKVGKHQIHKTVYAMYKVTVCTC